jgi:superfamily II DNA or RNA helicase
MQELRPYQAAALDKIRSSLRQGKRRVLLVAPTAAGKTTIAAAMIQGAVRKGGRVLFLAHRKELIDQCSTRLDQFGIDHGVIMASHPRRRPDATVQVASVQTLVRRQSTWEPSLIIVDEAHLSMSDSHQKIVRAFDVPAVGLTATPWRTDGRGLGDLFDDIVVAATPAELTRLGFLAPVVGFGFHVPNMKGAKTKGGDWSADDVEERMNTTRVIGGIVAQYQKHAAGKRAVCFAVTIAHSKNIIEQFVAAGIPAEHLDGATPGPEREGILRRLASGQTLVVSNVGVLTEGWDCPAVEVCILARPTKSVALYLQMAGRVLRRAPGKEVARLHDHAGNAILHGLPTMDREYTLTTSEGGGPRSKGAKALVRLCPRCFFQSPVGQTVCAECKEVFPPAKEVEEVEGKEVSLEELERIRSVVPRNFQHAEWLRLTALAKMRGYKAGWAAMQFKARFGRWPDFKSDEKPAEGNVKIPTALRKAGWRASREGK